jgi:hypothetical protein
MLQGDVKRDAAAILSRMIELRDQMRQLMPDDVAAELVADFPRTGRPQFQRKRRGWRRR